MTYLHYVYTHTRNDTGQLFYVGKGSGKRAYSQVWTEERKRKISEAKMGHKHTDATKAKVSASKKGIPWTAEQRIKIMAGRNKR